MNTMTGEEIVKEGYQKIAEVYHNRRLKSTGSLELLEKLIEKMPSQGNVLDVGCGGGYPVANFFSDRGYKVTGVDVSPEMIEIAKKTVPEGAFYVRNMKELDFSEKSFDIIVSFFAIIHVPRAWHAKIISRFYEMLKPNGMILISMGMKDTEEDINLDWHGTKMYWSHFDKETNLKLIQSAGFEVIWNEDVGPETDRHTWILAKKM